MPIITIDGPRLSREQKKDLVESFTREAARVTAIPVQAFVVLIKENDTDNVGVAGELLCDRLERDG